VNAVESKKVAAFAGSPTTTFLPIQITQQYHFTSIIYSDETRPVLQFQHKSNVTVAISVFIGGDLEARLWYGR
jgi:hypothetical protein